MTPHIFLFLWLLLNVPGWVDRPAAFWDPGLLGLLSPLLAVLILVQA